MIENNLFYKKLSATWLSVLSKDVQAKASNLPLERTEKELFIVSLMEHLLSILTHIENLTLPLEYIRNEKLPTHFQDPQLRDNYYRYHYENHVIRISSIFDYCLLYVNLIYDLGNPPKRVNHLLITENRKMHEQSKIELNKLANAISTVKAERNKMIHEGSFTNEIVKKIISNNLHWDLVELPKDEVLLNYFSEGKSKGIEELSQKMQNDVEALLAGVDNLLNSLVIQFERLTHTDPDSTH